MVVQAQPLARPLEVSIELRPHVGKMMDAGCIKSIVHPQWIVVATIGSYFHSQIGFLHHSEGSPLAALETFLRIPTGDRQAVLDAISEVAGWKVGVVTPPDRRRL